MNDSAEKSARPHICFLVPGDRGGGVIWVADSVCRQAYADGYEVTLLTMEPLSEATRKRINYPVDCLDVSPPYTDTPQKFVDWVEAKRPDYLFLNNCHTMDNCIPYLPPEVRTIYVVHDTMSFYRRAAIRHEKSLDAIVAVSEPVGRRIRTKLKQRGKLHIILNGTIFPPASEIIRELEETEIIFVGGDDPRKGAHDLLKLWPRLLKAGFGGKLHWLGRISADFEREIGQLPQRQRIMMHGFVDRTQVMRLMARSQVQLMLSRGEACSIAVLEAMGMGCLPVAWDIEATGTRDIVPPAFQFFAPLGDMDKMAMVVQEAAERRNSLASALIEYAREHFSEEVMWKKYRDLIKEIEETAYAPRPFHGRQVPRYKPPLRASYLIPKSLWRVIRPRLAKSARLYYFIRSKM